MKEIVPAESLAMVNGILGSVDRKCMKLYSISQFNQMQFFINEVKFEYVMPNL